jgi:hypothetical protein
VPILLPQDIPTAIFGSTPTTVVLGGIPIVITQFLAVLNITFGHNPYSTFGDVDFAVGITGMVDVAGGVLEGLAVDIVPCIKLEQVGIAFGESA